MSARSVVQYDKFINELKSHDWYYDNSEDFSVWRRGERNHKVLQAKSKAHPKMHAAFQAFINFHHKNVINGNQLNHCIKQFREELK